MDLATAQYTVHPFGWKRSKKLAETGGIYSWERIANGLKTWTPLRSLASANVALTFLEMLINPCQPGFPLWHPECLPRSHHTDELGVFVQVDYFRAARDPREIAMGGPGSIGARSISS